MPDRRPSVMFIYWGRRGLSRFALDIGRAAITRTDISASISVSRQNESFPAFAEFGDAVIPVDTFATNAGALVHAWRLPLIRRTLLRQIEVRRPDVVIEILPHVWSSFVAPTIKAAGIRYVTLIHDAETHPGDYRSTSIAWLNRRLMRQADLIVTLSDSVAGQIEAMGLVPRERIVPLFLPDFDFGARRALGRPRASEPARLLFLGRILPYKGLPLFVDLVEALRNEGIAVEAGIFGEGDLGESAARLRLLGAEVVDRWLSEGEIAEVLPRFHAVVLSHIEASQSGVAAVAFGAGLPVIATPVGGLVEQVKDGITGVVASRVDAAALAEATKRLLFFPQLYDSICDNLMRSRADRSVASFVEACVIHALGSRPAAASSNNYVR